MLYAGLDGALELDGMSGAAARVEGGAGTAHERVHVEGVLLVAEGRGLGGGAVGRGGCALAAGHAVDVVAHHDDGHVHVALGRMDEVVAANAGAVAVAGEDDDGLVRVHGLEALCLSQSAAVQGVQAVEVQVDRSPGGTSDAADAGHVIIGELKLVYGPDEAVDHDAVSAAGAEDEGQGLLPYVFFRNAVHITPPPRSCCKLRSGAGRRRLWS